jgi:hypothetical protein
MLNNEFRQPISVDFAPEESLCEWCGKPAVLQLIAVGGRHHNEMGYFCQACGEAFTRAVADSLSRAVTAEVTVQTVMIPEPQVR